MIMGKEQLISVIIPCYKVEKYLPVCVESVLSQTYGNFEIILVDDGSPDKCGEICDAFASKDRRIKVIHKENGGLSDARNVALDIMKGEYVVFVDSDDYISPTHIESLYVLIKKHDAQIAINNRCSFFGNEKPKIKTKYDRDYVFTGTESVEVMFYQGLFDTTAWGKMYKYELFFGIRYPKGLLFEDLPTIYKVLLKADKVVYNDNQSYFYRQRHDSIEGQSFSKHKLDSCLKIMCLMDNDHSRLLPILRSYDCRMTSFAFHILLQMPTNNSGRKLLEERIRIKRWSVLTDRRARKKTRIACLLSYVSFGLVQRVFNFTNKI